MGVAWIIELAMEVVMVVVGVIEVEIQVEKVVVW